MLYSREILELIYSVKYVDLAVTLSILSPLAFMNILVVTFVFTLIAANQSLKPFLIILIQLSLIILGYFLFSIYLQQYIFERWMAFIYLVSTIITFISLWVVVRRELSLVVKPFHILNGRPIGHNPQQQSCFPHGRLILQIIINHLTIGTLRDQANQTSC